MILQHQKFGIGDKCIIERVVIQAPFRFSVHFHNEACFIYFSEGSTKINSPHEQTPIAPVESVLLKCGSYFADLLKPVDAGKYEVLVIHLYPDILRKIYRHEIPSMVKDVVSQSFIQKITRHDGIRRFIDNLYFYFDNPGLINDELLEIKIRELILLLLTTENATSIADLFARLFTPQATTIRSVIDSHLFSGLSIKDLAKLANLSLSTFNRSFRATFNDTPANYIRTRRLQRAKDLLAIDSLTISQIAFQTCFTDVAHFSRLFKACYNQSPSGYRRLIQSHP